jgi:indole-3-glycerol phosphate synthase
MNGYDRLREIVAAKRRRVAAMKSDLERDERAAVRTPREGLDPRRTARFRDRLLAGPPALIAEVKRGSPSRGLFARDLDPAALARAYRDGGADAISVVTDEDHFFATPGMFAAVRAAVKLPLLQKDFFIDPVQLVAARRAGAELVLLIAAALPEDDLARLLSLSHELDLEALVEVHTERECETAIRAGAEIVGVNNRDLRTFTVDLDTTRRLAPLVPPGRAVVAESGIHTPADVARLRAAGVHGFLVGESLVTHPHPARHAAALRAAARGE